MDPASHFESFPPVDLLGADGAILLPSILAAWWFWRGRRHGSRLPAFLPIAVWGLATAAISYRYFLDFAHRGMTDTTRDGFLAIRWSFWSLAFEALAGLTVLTMVLTWHRVGGVASAGRFGKLRSLLPFLGVFDLLLGLGACLYFVAPDIPRQITTFHATEDGLWIGTASSFDEPALFHREHGASGPPRVLENGPRRVQVLAATEDILGVGGRKVLWQGPATFETEPWTTLADPFVRSLVAHRGWWWAGGPNPLVRHPLPGNPQPSDTLPRIRTDDLTVGVLRDVHHLVPLGDTLWIGNRDGLFRWRPGDGRHVHRVLPELRWIRDLVAVDDTLWIAGHQNLLRWRPGDGSQDPEPPAILQVDDRISTLFHHRPDGVEGQRLWIAGQRGLYYLDPSDPSHQVSSGGPPKIRVFHPAADDGLWLGGIDGLYRWDPEPDRFEHIAPETEWITALTETPDGLWIGTWSQGLYLLVSDTGPATKLQRIDLGDLSHGWQRHDHLAGLAVAWLGLLALVLAAVGWRRPRTTGR